MVTSKIWSPLIFVVGLSCSDALLAASCEYEVRSEWNSGFTVAVTLTNDSAEVIEGWTVSWAYSDGSTVSQAWDTSLSGTGPYVASSYGYNGNIAVGDSVSFGFNGNKSVSGAPAEIPLLGGSCSSVSTNLVPLAVFDSSTSTGSIPFEVTFDASASSDPEGSPLTYRWDFGGGDTDSGVLVSRTYSEAGSYPVSLVVNDGVSDSSPVVTTIVAIDDMAEPPIFVLDSSSSSLYFVSTKKTHTVETHSFTTLSGAISESGVATLKVNLDSVDTGIELRNERMRSLLFETSLFSEAVITLPVDLASLSSQTTGSVQRQTVSAALNLHGVESELIADIFVTKLSNDHFVVQNAAPILIKAADHNLEAGIDALEAAANLSVISTTVPVSFTLHFQTAE